LEVQRRSTALEFRHALEGWLIPDEAAQPFVFRNGAVAHTTEELVTLCDQHWFEARQHLADGDFDHWFRARNRHDLVAKARSAKLEQNVDAALEAFLRRLNPRLPLPQLVAEPPTLDFGRVPRSGVVSRSLTVRNTGRGYGQASLSPSVPWIRFDKPFVGCLFGTKAPVSVDLDVTSLPLRGEHQAIIACTPVRGARISIPVTVEVSLVREVRRRIAAGLRGFGQLTSRGARRGSSLWMQAFRGLLRSRYGRWILLAETLVLYGAMVALWWIWRGLPAALDDLAWTLLGAVPVTLLVVYLLPALAFVGGAMIWEAVKALGSKLRTPIQG
jgi:hypothetical protein